jgi:HPt (histidine-containing phosphotransfer) domain-containing protein
MDVNADVEALRRLRKAGGVDLVKKMIALFLDNLPVRVHIAVAGTRAENWAEVERAGHSLKSSAGYLGLRELAERANALEELAVQGKRSDIEPLLRELSDSVPALRFSLQKLVNEL